MQRRRRPGRFLPLIVVLLLCAAVLWQQQNISDWMRLYAYDAPAPVARLADEVQLTPQARRMFYVNHPELQDRSAFNVSCSSRGEHTIVLGCYHPVDRGIYLFHVSDERLRGVNQVTAAHEMLHAGYDRLSKRERKRIDGLLQDYYNTRLADDRIKSVIAIYQKTEPNDISNEMHSVFGTEAATLTPELETYYSQYFSDRSKVVKYANDYQAEFTTRQTQVADYDAKLDGLKKQIDTNTNRLELMEAQIAAYRKQMDSQRASNDFAGYNRNVPLYNQQVDSYNGLIASTKEIISSYNRLVAVRNDLALQVTELAHSIDSTFQPI